MTRIDIKEITARLLTRQNEILEESKLARSSRDAVELDQSKVGRLSRMDAMQGQAMAQATERRRQQEFIRIEAALARIKSGDYGICASCDEDIAPKRLALDPSVAVCIKCASI
jgi:DnaK suppressor protein